MALPIHHNVYIIGAGGVGSWLLPLLVRLVGPEKITVYDGDTLEHKNLDRQLFTEDDLGQNKATALALRYGVTGVPEYLVPGLLEPRRKSVLFGCADNDPARKLILDICDRFACVGIIGANEYTDAEAYIYSPRWKDTARDPRVFYPNILTNTADDPTRPDGCTGEIQERTPQLVPANYMAAGLMTHLYEYFFLPLHEDGVPFREAYPDENHHPHHHRMSFAHFRTIKGADRQIPALAEAA